MKPNEMLKQFRESQGYSLRQFADVLNDQLPPDMGTYFMALHNWETGQAPIPFYMWFYLSHKANGELQMFARLLVKEMVG